MTALIVEDDEDSRAVIQEVLEDAGYAVVSVDTAEAAITYLSGAPSCVVLLDYLLVGINGSGVLQAAEDDGSMRRHRFVLLTAMTLSHLPAHDRRLIQMYCTSIVTKPFELSELLQAVAQAAEAYPPCRLRGL